MKTQPISMFRVNLLNYEEPVQVTVQGRVVGTWMPGPVMNSTYTPQYTGNATDNFTGKPVVDWETPTVSTPVFGQQTSTHFGSSRPAPKPGKTR